MWNKLKRTWKIKCEKTSTEQFKKKNAVQGVHKAGITTVATNGWNVTWIRKGHPW